MQPTAAVNASINAPLGLAITRSVSAGDGSYVPSLILLISPSLTMSMPAAVWLSVMAVPPLHPARRVDGIRADEDITGVFDSPVFSLGTNQRNI
jgi:hypothetical protein